MKAVMVSCSRLRIILLQVGLPTAIKKKKINLIEVYSAAYMSHTHVQASAFSIFDVHFCYESHDSNLFTVYFYLP